MRRLASFISITVAASLSTGCQNPYTTFYKGQQDARKSAGYSADQPRLEILASSDVQKDVLSFIRKGYFVCGESSFEGNSNVGDIQDIKRQALAVGATVVVFSNRYSRTVSSTMYLTLPTSSTTYTNGSATAYGSGGSVTAFGSSTSTTYGTSTEAIPYSVSRSRFDAVFMFKGTRPRVGIIPEELNDSIRQSIGTNSGILVSVVVEGSPAFTSDILPGDVVVSINGERISSPANYLQLLDKYQGEDAVFAIVRSGTSISKSIHILPLAN